VTDLDLRPVRQPTLCRHCQRSGGLSSIDVLRVQGWRFFTGTSQTGKAIEDVICPWCAGTATAPEPGWRVRCQTCDWEYEDDNGEGPLDVKAAKQLARDHECEPWVEISPPGEERWGGANWFNDDGTGGRR
jgi:hypothetical protein